MRALFFVLLLVLTITNTVDAQAESPQSPPVNVAKVAAFLSVGPSLAHITLDDGGRAPSPVGTQFGVVSLSVELRVLFFERFGFALTPLTWQPNGGIQDSGDHWRFVRVGGGLRLQTLSSESRAQLTFGYDVNYLRATDVEHCFLCSDYEERARTSTALGHSFSLRLDTAIARSGARVGARIEGGFSSDFTMSWITAGASIGFGQRT